jgi:DNA polymerase-3 subunit gamma/tau
VAGPETAAAAPLSTPAPSAARESSQASPSPREQFDAPGAGTPAAEGAQDAAAGAGAAATATAATRDLESLRSLWPAVVDLVRGENALLGALIAEAQPVETDGEDLTIAFASSKPFLRKKASVPLNRAAVTEALRAVTGGRWRVAFELRDDLVAEEDQSPEPARSEEEWVRRFMEEFDAEEIPGERGHERDLAGDGEELEAATSEEKGH